MTSTLFESFIVFYLIEILILGAIAVNILREAKQDNISEDDGNVQSKKGPSASDLIKMRAVAKELERQNK